MRSLFSLTVAPLNLQISYQNCQILSIEEDDNCSCDKNQQRDKLMQTHKNSLNVVFMFNDEIKLWENLKNQAQDDNRGRSQIDHFIRS